MVLTMFFISTMEPERVMDSEATTTACAILVYLVQNFFLYLTDTSKMLGFINKEIHVEAQRNESVRVDAVSSSHFPFTYVLNLLRPIHLVPLKAGTIRSNE